MNPPLQFTDRGGGFPGALLAHEEEVVAADIDGQLRVCVPRQVSQLVELILGQRY